jgi:hypothetical protein
MLMSQSQSNITGFFRSATSGSSVSSSITPSQSSPSPLQPATKKIRSRSPERDEEEVGIDDDDLTLKCLKLEPGDMPYEAWLVRVVNAAGRIGFICRCCRVSEPPGIWTTKPLYVNSGRMQAIKRHGTECQTHLRSAQAFFKDSTVMSDMLRESHNKTFFNLQRQMRIAEFIAMNKLPLTMYPKMIALNIGIGTFGDKTGIYEGFDAGKEMMEALAYATRSVMQQRWTRASEIGVTIDETTDRSVKSQMIIFYKYFSDGILYEDCAGVEQLPNGKAETIMAALMHHLKKDSINIKTITFFGTDGAGVMVGSKKGVHKRLSQLNPCLIGYHCALHRWSLVCKHAATSLPKMQHFFDNFEALARHYTFSATRRWELHHQQRLLDIKKQELVEACFTRWLTHDNLTEALLDSLPAVVTQLRVEVESDKADDVQAIGFLSFLASEDTLFYLMCVRDIVPILTHLAIIVQGVDIDLIELQRQIDNVILKLSGFIQNPGPNTLAFAALCTRIQTAACKPLRQSPWHCLETTRIQYILAIVENIRSYFPSLPIMAHFDNVLNPRKFEALIEEESIPSDCLQAILRFYETSSHFHGVTQFGLEMQWGVFARFAIYHKDETYTADEEYVDDDVAVHWDYSKGKPPVMRRTIQKLLTVRSLIVMFLGTANIERQNPAICKVMRIYLSFTLTTSSCERGFSVLKLTKTALRTCLGQPFLDILVSLGHVKEEAPHATLELAMLMFISQKERR